MIYETCEEVTDFLLKPYMQHDTRRNTKHMHMYMRMYMYMSMYM